MRILIGIPTHDRRIDIDIIRTVIQLERNHTHEFDYMFPVSSHIARNRNMICIEALRSNHDAVLFWDSDIGIPDFTFVEKLIETGYKLNASIVGGAYRMKKLNETIYVAGAFEDDGRIKNLTEVKIPMLVEGVGTGIMLIFRRVLEVLDDPWFTIVDKPNLDVMPEDFEFCRKAKEKGFKVAIDPRFNTYHYGFYAWEH